MELIDVKLIRLLHYYLTRYLFIRLIFVHNFLSCSEHFWCINYSSFVLPHHKNLKILYWKLFYNMFPKRLNPYDPTRTSSVLKFYIFMFVSKYLDDNAPSIPSSREFHGNASIFNILIESTTMKPPPKVTYILSLPHFPYYTYCV
jgi:hypothetical protein